MLKNTQDYDNLIKCLSAIVLLILAVVPVFGHLGTLPLRDWDEARLAINAYEMLNNEDYLVTYVNGKPDLWNTKPPLMIWLQVFSMKLIGINETAVRLPSAIAAFLTLLLLMFFSLKYLKDYWFGFISVLLLVTFQGFIGIHSARTGDYDALLAFFTTAYSLAFFLYLEKNKPKYIYLVFLFLTLSVFTKSIAGLLFLPALFVYSLYKWKILLVLKDKHFYFGLFASVILVSAYFFFRESANPGYLNAVWQNELGGRYLNTLEAHHESYWFYFDRLIENKLSGFHLLIPVGLLIGLLNTESLKSRLALFVSLISLIYFIVISQSETKLEWYVVPLYPLLAIIISFGLTFIFKWVGELKVKGLVYNVLPIAFLFLVFASPYQDILEKTYKPTEPPENIVKYEIGYYLQEAVKGTYDIGDSFLLYKGYNLQLKFYLNILNDKGIDIAFKNWEKLENGDHVIAYQDEIKDYIKAHYEFSILNTDNNVVIYNIYDRK